MAKEDFDIDALAKYLHLTPPQVSRMADRGTLPGRKVGGKWQFPQAEIHHWLEDRIGVSGEEELIEVEGVLQRHAETEEAIPTISHLLPEQAIAVPLPARTRGSVITEMTKLAADSGLLWDPEKMAEAVRARENLHSTALDNGVALLHPRRPLPNILAEAFLAMGRTHQGIPFGGGRGNLTDIFFLICSTDDRSHLRILARLSRLIADGSLLTELRDAEGSAEAHRLIESHEEKMFGET